MGSTTANIPVEEFDVLIVGAGLSGINAAYRLQQALPNTTFAVLEARDTVGGTWSFWKFPGVRSDSSLAVFGLPWHPWSLEADFASADDICTYLRSAARAAGLFEDGDHDEGGVAARLRLRHRVVRSDWSSAEQRWTLRVEAGEERQVKVFRASWVISCTGYYDYSKPLLAVIPGIDNFGGEVVHPQFWRDDVVYEGKRVVIIGSGATAITMLPVVAAKAKHTTMLQRSPSYVMSEPSRDRWTATLKRWLPSRLAAKVNWWRRMLLEFLFVNFLLNFPNAGRRMLTSIMRKMLPKGYPVDVHFNPRYNPFEQRLCICPDGDFFKALHKDNCEVVTDTIDTVTKTGIKLTSGKEIESDMLITATGLHMTLLGGSTYVDNKLVELGGRYVWRSAMIEGIPNSCLVTGYVAGTWTPGADIHTRTVLSVIKHMKRIGATSATPIVDERERPTMAKLPVMPNSSTYIVAARDRFPISSGKQPWCAGKNWWFDSWSYLFGGVTKGMKYHIPAKPKVV